GLGGETVRMSREVGECAGRVRARVCGGAAMRALAVCVSVAALTLECAHGAAAAGLIPLVPVHVSPTRGITEFAIPSNKGRPSAIALGRDGNLWFAETRQNSIGRITPRGKITEFGIPSSKGEPRGITAGPDGNLWFTEGGSNKIGRISTSGKITEFP